MRPVWFRAALAMLALSSASFALVDLSLKAIRTAPPPRALTAVFETEKPAEDVARPAAQAASAVERSLFAAAGRIEPNDAADEVDPDTGDPVLRGVVIVGGRRQALIAPEPGEEGEWVVAGGRIGDALVEIIEPRRAFLRRAGAGFWISLEAAGG